ATPTRSPRPPPRTAASSAKPRSSSRILKIASSETSKPKARSMERGTQMKGKHLRWGLAGLLSTLCAGVAIFGLPEMSAKADDPIQMKLGTVAPDGTPWEKQLREVKAYIERETQGRVRVKTFMGGSLGGEKQLVRRVAQNTLQAF